MNITVKSIYAIMGLSIASLLVGPAMAGSHDYRVNARQHNQHERIQQGVRSGQLNRHEALRLGNEQRSIHAEERRYKSDGVFTRAERSDLRHDQNRASRHIYNEKHDGQHRMGSSTRSGMNALHSAGRASRANVDTQQHDQRERIQEGVRSGQLTKGEARQLIAEQRAIRQEERLYKSDGVLTRDERKDLYSDLSLASQHIYNEKHDAETRR